MELSLYYHLILKSANDYDWHPATDLAYFQVQHKDRKNRDEKIAMPNLFEHVRRGHLLLAADSTVDDGFWRQRHIAQNTIL